MILTQDQGKPSEMSAFSRRNPLTLLAGSMALALPQLAAAEPVNFSREVLPVLSDRCFYCHGPDEKHRKADLRLDDENAAIKAESCGDCHSYLKAFYLQTDPGLELVADDLASLALDAEVEREGFARSGFNPLLTPSQ